MTNVECDVWVLPIGGRGGDANDVHTIERSPSARPERGGDRLRHTAGRRLVRAVVAQRVGVRPEEVTVALSCRRCGSRKHGKPFVERFAGHVSIAHSAGLVVVAVTDAAPVGVDVEDRTADVLLGPTAVLISSCDEDLPTDRAGLFRAWCRKEAVLKATGDGLAIAMRDISVSPREQVALVRVPGWDTLAAVCDVDLGARYHEYTAALAVLSSGNVSVRVREGNVLIRGGLGGRT